MISGVSPHPGGYLCERVSEIDWFRKRIRSVWVLGYVHGTELDGVRDCRSEKLDWKSTNCEPPSWTSHDDRVLGICRILLLFSCG